MSSNYMEHPELFPEMSLTDAYYLDHVHDARKAKAVRAAFDFGRAIEEAAKEADTKGSTSAPQEETPCNTEKR